MVIFLQLALAIKTQGLYFLKQLYYFIELEDIFQLHDMALVVQDYKYIIHYEKSLLYTVLTCIL